MEERRPKRRKIEKMEGLAVGEKSSEASRERAESLGNKMEIIEMPKLMLPAPGRRQWVQRLSESPKSSQELPIKIHARQLFPTQANSVIQPPAASASTVLAIAIVDGQGVVSELDLPMPSTNVWISGYGELTMNGATVPSVPMTNGATFPTLIASETKPSNTGFNPAAVTPPPAVAASQARGQALQTQEVIAKQLNVVPQAPTDVAAIPSSAAPVPTSVGPVPSSPEAAQHASTSQIPMAINVSGSSSQQVPSSLSTPIPATPQSAASSSVYFSSSPASLPNSASSHITDVPTSLQTTNTHNPQPPASNNVTVPCKLIVLSLDLKIANRSYSYQSNECD